MPKGLQKITVTVGEKHLTHFGGIFLIHSFCKKIGLNRLLQRKICFQNRSGRYQPTELILSIIYAIIVGIPRLNQVKILQGNGAFQRIIGLKTFPYASSLRRFLKRTDPNVIQSINRLHDYLRLKMFYLPKPRTSLLFDFDSSVLTIYGKYIEEARVGYNPRKRGARSYHPLLCFEYHSREFWHGVLRPGNVYTSAGSVDFLHACLAKVPPYVYRIRVRADSGFFDHKFIEPLDENKIGYAIVAKLTSTIKRRLEGLDYHQFRKNWEAADFYYTPREWKSPHRIVIIRRLLPEKPSEQPTLFTLKRYAYQAYVTNLPMKSEYVWYFYRQRAAIELNIKELKEDYVLAKIPTNSFLANQMYFYLLLFAYNIINWFKRICLPKKFQNSTLKTIRNEILVLPARLVKVDNRNVLKLPKEYISQKSLEHIIYQIENIKPL